MENNQVCKKLLQNEHLEEIIQDQQAYDIEGKKKMNPLLVKVIPAENKKAIWILRLYRTTATPWLASEIFNWQFAARVGPPTRVI